MTTKRLLAAVLLALAAFAAWVVLSWPRVPDPRAVARAGTERGIDLLADGRTLLARCLEAHGDDAAASRWRALQIVEAEVVEDGWSDFGIADESPGAPVPDAIAVYRHEPATDRLWFARWRPETRTLLAGVVPAGDHYRTRHRDGPESEPRDLPFALRSLRFLASLPFKFADAGFVIARSERIGAAGGDALVIAFEPAKGMPAGDRYRAELDPATGRLRDLVYRPKETWAPTGVRVRFEWAECARGLWLPSVIEATTVPGSIRTHRVVLRR